MNPGGQHRVRRGPRSWRASTAIAALAFAAPVAGCSLLVSLDGLSAGSSDADSSTADAPFNPDSPIDLADGSTGADGSDSASPQGCGGRPGIGAPMLRVLDAGFCIDTTEVTYDQYAVFYAANPSPTSTECTWKSGYTPPPEHGSAAIGNVDWCDANEFCAWAGKRLCGGIGGTVMDLTNSLTGADEWQYTCTHGDNAQFVWPYGSGSGPNPDVCLYADSPDSGQSRAVASNPACVGPAGVFDMSGNVWEWENACDRSTGDPASLDCNLRGGGFLRDSNSWGNCLDVPGGWARNSHVADTGIRCCSDWN